MDRNAEDWLNAGSLSRSLSARRAWIEIMAHTARKTSIAGSLSARRAWIEIFVPFDVIRPAMSLSARRAWIEILASRLADMSAACRSPQGERG